MAKTKGKKQQGKAVKNKSAGAGKRTTQTKEKTDEGKGKGAKSAPAVRKSCTAKGSCQTSSSPASTRQRSQTSRSTSGANAQSQQAAPKNDARTALKKGAALRTRDEFLENGIPKEEYLDKPEQYYRVVYTVEVNAINEAAVVKRTTKKGRHLKSRPSEKFREEIIVKDNSGDGIKIGKKFIRSQIDDITNEDVEYIKKRISHYPDTKEKMQEFKSRTKKTPPK